MQKLMLEDEISTEETVASPSEEDNTEVSTEPVQETSTEVKTVPYDRFKSVVEERNKYKELLSVNTEPTPSVNVASMSSDYEDNDVDKLVKPLIEQTVGRKFNELNRQMELDRTISQNPDFFQYADSIKAKIQENPHLTWGDAYKLSKFDTVQAESRELGRKEVIQNIQEKKRATVESASKTKAIPSAGVTGEINPLAKGPDGKFLFSTKELEDVLPRG